jgi:ribosomal protein S18 acetylase RimI-like enzyme
MAGVELPAGYLVRSPRPDDAQAIYGLVAAYNLKVLGNANITLAEVNEILRASSFQPDHDGWLIVDGSGRAANFACVQAGVSQRIVQLSFATADAPGSEWLLETGIARGRELIGSGGGVVEVGLHRENVVLIELVRSRGLEHGTTYFKMRIDHDGPVGVPEPPAGTTVRLGADDETVRRAIHAVMTEAFRAQEHAAIRPYDEWVERHENRASSDWSQMTLVEADGRPAAASDCNHAFVETDNCGYVGRLAVIPEARGLGLAKYLLRQAFATDAAAGLDGTILHVDTNNPTPALGLYESVGMRPVQIADVWELKV